MADKDTKAMKQALSELFDTDDSKVMKALKKITREGKAHHITALMDCYVQAKEGPIKDELTKMLQSMKLEGGEEALVSLLGEDRFADHNAFILTCIWNSGYQPVEHMDTLVNVALQGDFMTTFEAITVIENLEPPFDMDALAVASLAVDDYVDQGHIEEKTPLIDQLKILVDQMKTAMLPEEESE